MKKFMEFTVQFKFVWGLIFSTAILIYTMVNMFLGHSSMQLIVIWQLFFLSIVLTGIYYVIFAEFILKWFSSRYKILIHLLSSYIVLMVSIYLFNWITDFHSFILFTIGYILLYLSASLSFYLYYKATGEELNDKLASYKEKRNIK